MPIDLTRKRFRFYIYQIHILSALLILATKTSAANFRAEPVITGLDFPIVIAFSADRRLFFTERCTGNVRVIEGIPGPQPRLNPEPVYRFGPVSCYFERGLLGIVLDPKFKDNGFLYVYYSHKGSGPRNPYRHRLMRITVRNNRGVDPVAILDNLPIGSQMESGKGNHNGGNIIFGPDGKLYLSIGELGEPDNSQDLSSFAGKILRINPDGSAPSNNPFYDPFNPRNPRSYIYAYGLRNSFDLIFHPVTGLLYATENGPETNDELNIIYEGKNYGWGTEQISGKQNKPGLEDPLLIYSQTIAPTGITFYTGSKYPSEYFFNLFFADWNRGHIHRVIFDGREGKKILRVDDNFYVHTDGIIDLIDSTDGNLYFTDPQGIYRLVFE
jgi:glucose/arabinose dehydrogenase